MDLTTAKYIKRLQNMSSMELLRIIRPHLPAFPEFQPVTSLDDLPALENALIKQFKPDGKGGGENVGGPGSTYERYWKFLAYITKAYDNQTYHKFELVGRANLHTRLMAMTLAVTTTTNPYSTI